MKGGVAAMTMALQILLQLDLRPRGDIFIEYVVDEEVTGFGTLSAIARGYRADAGICAETSDLAIQPACIGRLWFTVEIEGKPSSISTRWQSVSAIDKGIKVVQAVEELERIRIQDLTHPLYSDNRRALPCAVCMFDAGTFPSATPDKAVLRGSLGLLPYEDVQAVKRQFVAHLDHMAQADVWLRYNPLKITFKDLGADGAEIPADHPIVTTVTNAYQDALGEAPVISGRTGGSDTRYLIKYGDTPTVIFGPGVTAQMHAMNEYLPQDYLIKAVKTMALAIHEWCA
jgi:acetylornithine deacetylase